MILFAAWVILSFVIFRIAQKMNKNAISALIISLIFSPFIGLLYVLASKEISNPPIINSGHSQSKDYLPNRFLSLGDMTGKTFQEIAQVVGAPNSYINTSHFRICSWIAPGYRITIKFNQDGLFMGIVSEAAH